MQSSIFVEIEPKAELVDGRTHQWQKLNKLLRREFPLKMVNPH